MYALRQLSTVFKFLETQVTNITEFHQTTNEIFRRNAILFS